MQLELSFVYEKIYEHGALQSKAGQVMIDNNSTNWLLFLFRMNQTTKRMYEIQK